MIFRILFLIFLIRFSGEFRKYPYCIYQSLYSDKHAIKEFQENKLFALFHRLQRDTSAIKECQGNEWCERISINFEALGKSEVTMHGIPFKLQSQQIHNNGKTKKFTYANYGNDTEVTLMYNLFGYPSLDGYIQYTNVDSAMKIANCGRYCHVICHHLVSCTCALI